MKLIFKYMFLFLAGGVIYYFLEILFRGRSHTAMIAVGGTCFILCGLLNEVMDWKTPLALQMLICTALITVVEFISGIVLNIWLKLDIWDYSNLPFNILGQICIPFCILWYFLSAVAIIWDDYLRFWLFGEEKPHYILFGRSK